MAQAAPAAAWRAVAADNAVVFGVLHAGERGVTTRPRIVLVEGSWAEGDTVRLPEGTTSAKKTAANLSG